jgi:hypothetical protein
MHTQYQRGEKKSGASWNIWGAACRGAPCIPRKALDFPQARRDKGFVPPPVERFLVALEVCWPSFRLLQERPTGVFCAALQILPTLL